MVFFDRFEGLSLKVCLDELFFMGLRDHPNLQIEF